MRNPFKIFFTCLAADIKAFDRDNTDEKKVISATFFSAYKRRFVIKNRLPGSTSFCLFKILFINGTKNPNRRANEKTIRHEYGHSIQEEYMGFFRYLRRVAVPSLKGYKKKLTPKEYYAQKWEYDADILGDVRRWE